MSKHVVNTSEMRLINHTNTDTTIISTNKDKLQVNADLVINGNVEKYYTIMNIDATSWNVTYNDDTQYFSTANNLEVLEDSGSNWSVDTYTVPASGRYAINLNMSCDTYGAALATFFEIYNADGVTLEKTFRGIFSDDAFVRHTLATTDTLPAGKKIKIRVKYTSPGPGTVKLEGITGTDYRTYFSINRI